MQKSQNHKTKSQRTYHLNDRVSTPCLALYQKYKEDKYVQFTSLFIRTYASAEEVDRLLEVLSPDEYAYILHNKDVNSEGVPKEAHIHLLLYKKSYIRLTKILTFTTQATRVEIPRSKKYAYEYLTHKNDPDKVSYSSDEIHEFHKGVNTFSVTQQEARENRNLQLLDDIGNLSRRQMAEKYGSDYIKNYQRYEAFMEVVKNDEMLQEVDKVATSISATDELYFPDVNGDIVRLSMADFVSWQIRSVFDEFYDESKHLPDSREIVHIYYRALRVYEEQRKKATRLSKYEEVD